jgi:hypothetical protein
MVNNKGKNQLYTLIPIEDFKALMGVDDKEDKMCRFCLVTATLAIEQYCKRKLRRKNILNFKIYRIVFFKTISILDLL